VDLRPRTLKVSLTTPFRLPKPSAQFLLFRKVFPPLLFFPKFEASSLPPTIRYDRSPSRRPPSPWSFSSYFPSLLTEGFFEQHVNLFFLHPPPPFSANSMTGEPLMLLPFWSHVPPIALRLKGPPLGLCLSRAVLYLLCASLVNHFSRPHPLPSKDENISILSFSPFFEVFFFARSFCRPHRRRSLFSCLIKTSLRHVFPTTLYGISFSLFATFLLFLVCCASSRVTPFPFF